MIPFFPSGMPDALQYLWKKRVTQAQRSLAWKHDANNSAFLFHQTARNLIGGKLHLGCQILNARANGLANSWIVLQGSAHCGG